MTRPAAPPGTGTTGTGPPDAGARGAAAPRRRPYRWRRILAGGVAAVLTGAALVLPAADRPEPTEVPPSPPGVLRVMPLGASSTVGVGSTGTAGYRLPLWERLAADGVRLDYVGSRSSGPDALPDTDHEGRSGWTAGRMLPYVSGWVLAAEPDVVLLHAGTNDLIKGTSPETTADLLDRVLGQVFVAAPEAHVIMAGVWAPLPKKRAERARLGELLPGVAEKHRAAGHSVEYADVSGLIPVGLTVDGVHGTPAAYRSVAAMWAGRIEAWLARTPSVGGSSARE
ncbi:GDSL-type esterase/lipase family protein [Pseudonocardia nematodicida]|uniref:GDSL-type esterase/lipase family protein n=1 Tax=Pseudonocardia nematodicida TaxID=1206997 RepID=A0ABV1K9Z1_9PSEU